MAITPDGRQAYVAQFGTDTDPGNTVSVIDTIGKRTVATIKVGMNPIGVAITPDSRHAYITNAGIDSAPGGTLSVIDTGMG